jgi:uncharacterized membrane protein
MVKSNMYFALEDMSVGMRAVFALAYLFIDFVYITSSKTVYAEVTENGFPSLSPSRIAGIMLAYGALILGWLFFVTNMVHQLLMTSHLSPMVLGLVIGSVYGFVVYGVFNGTVYVMYKKYSVPILFRDMAWGIASASLITSMYAVAVAPKVRN